MLTPEKYRPRVIDSHIDFLLESFGALCIQGPKWCGKTWTSLNHANSVTYLADPAGNFSNRGLAEISPQLVLAGETPHLVDEWQEVPQIWDAVRFAVDQSGNKGQFILTGSATPQRKGILHSGAGRIATVNMHTMSLFETGESSGDVSLRQLFNIPFGAQLSSVHTGEVSIHQLLRYCIRGGWPANIDASGRAAAVLPQKYLESILNDDITRIDGKERSRSKTQALVHSLARNVSTVVSNRTLLSDMRKRDEVTADENTVAEYLDIFARLFMTWEQDSFHPSLRSSRRSLRSPKRHFADPSLAVAALGAREDTLLAELHTFGFIFESLVAHDLLVYSQAIDAQLFHWRDAKGNEIDAVIEMPDGTWGAFEVKLGAHQIDVAAANLLKLRQAFATEAESEKSIPAFLCVICGLSSAAYTRPDGVHVIPVTALRP